VVWVSELAVCSSSLVAIDGRMDARPLVKNGEASISSALSTYSSHVSVRLTVRMKAMATAARIRSLAIMTCLRFSRSSTTPATGPISTAGMARDSITPLTTSPDLVCATARLKTAMLLKWSPISLTTCPAHVYR
jgi:hypothetical protein